MKKIKVGITIGDPSGIGPFISALALEKLDGLADFVVIGDARVFEKAKNGRRKTKNYTFVDLNNITREKFQFGKVKAEYGRASIEYIDKAAALIEEGRIDCLVTCPISKESVHLAGINAAGHTEYLARLANIKDYVMMLLNNRLKISLVTRHIPIKTVPSNITAHDLVKTITISHRYLKEFFAINKPRIVVCGLNPHASDNGIIGKEENKVIKPVIRGLKRQIWHLDGPLSADIAITSAEKGKYDCVIAMYHDQALIPLKLLSSSSGVNMTLGLGYVRTSPLHGTAFDIAAKACADPSSLIEAIKLAVKCQLNLKKT